jgi:hypothetical protein
VGLKVFGPSGLGRRHGWMTGGVGVHQMRFIERNTKQRHGTMDGDAGRDEVQIILDLEYR